MTLFGTDGVRGSYPERINEELVARLVAGFCATIPPGNLIIGRDTRSSGLSLARAAGEAGAGSGRVVVDLGVVPTPLVSMAIGSRGAVGGVVLSASHNPPHHNGIKFFDGNGAKLLESSERLIERAMPKNPPHGTKGDEVDGVEEYLERLEGVIPSREGRWHLDVAYGAACEVAPAAFRRLGREVVMLHHQPRGERINVDCGVLGMDALVESVRADPNAKGGFAFDGDADRCLALSPQGEVLDGDDLLYAWTAQEVSEGRAVECVVGTTMSNGGLGKALSRLGTRLVRVGVGDREVAEGIALSRASLGGEPSGHTIFPGIAPTGDGILSALIWTELAGEGTMDDWVGAWEKHTQVHQSIPLTEKARSRWEKEGERRERTARRELPDEVRIIVRPSGTEQILRLMVEHADATVAKDSLHLLLQKVRAWL